jgi:hypothetical protein
MVSYDRFQNPATTPQAIAPLFWRAFTATRLHAGTALEIRQTRIAAYCAAPEQHLYAHIIREGSRIALSQTVLQPRPPLDRSGAKTVTYSLEVPAQNYVGRSVLGNAMGFNWSLEGPTDPLCAAMNITEVHIEGLARSAESYNWGHLQLLLTEDELLPDDPTQASLIEIVHQDALPAGRLGIAELLEGVYFDMRRANFAITTTSQIASLC